MTRKYSKAEKAAWNLIERVVTANPAALVVASGVVWVGGVILAVTQTQLLQWLLQ